jgi:hypothetical protein
MKKDYKQFDLVLSYVRMYFAMEYHAGTREMVYRFVCSKMGDVPYLMISAALRVLKDNGAILHEKRCWWSIADR